jgi:hypothetical protein
MNLFFYQAHAATVVTDEMMAAAQFRFSHNTPATKEVHMFYFILIFGPSFNSNCFHCKQAYFIRSIFESCFPEHSARK